MTNSKQNQLRTLSTLAPFAVLAFSVGSFACPALNPERAHLAPVDGETAVPVSVQPLIMGQSVTLEDEDGTAVPISLERAGSAAQGGVWLDGPVHFQSHPLHRVVPAEPLRPDTEYVLTVSEGVFPDPGYLLDGGDPGAPTSVTFTTAAASATPPAKPTIPAGFSMNFSFVPSASSSSCEGPGQIELSGWDDGTWLEVCFDYRAVLEDAAETVGSRELCTLTRHPFRFIIDEGDSDWGRVKLRWLEGVEVRALGVDGQVSSPRILSREELKQFRVDEGGGVTRLVPPEVDSAPKPGPKAVPDAGAAPPVRSSASTSDPRGDKDAKLDSGLKVEPRQVRADASEAPPVRESDGPARSTAKGPPDAAAPSTDVRASSSEQSEKVDAALDAGTNAHPESSGTAVRSSGREASGGCSLGWSGAGQPGMAWPLALLLLSWGFGLRRRSAASKPSVATWLLGAVSPPGQGEFTCSAAHRR